MSATLYDNQIRFNSGFHDGQHDKSRGIGSNGINRFGCNMRTHFDKVYAAGWLAGQLLPLGQTSSLAAWKASGIGKGSALAPKTLSSGIGVIQQRFVVAEMI